MPFYAVAKGKKIGVCLSWPECQEQILGFKGAVFKKFGTRQDAEIFIQERSGNTIDKRKKNEVSELTQKSEIADNNEKMSPTLLNMQKEMKHHQRKLSTLRDKFDSYVNSKSISEDSSSTAGGSTSTKRKTEMEATSSKRLKTTDEDGFNVDSDGFLVVYTDGSCGFNGMAGAQAGIGVFFGPGNSKNASLPVLGRATNNTAEIQAAVHALKIAKAAGFEKVRIKTDSKFMISCVTSWMPGWKKGGWKKKGGGEVINKEDLISLDKASEGLLVSWNHVAGHTGNPGNEAADKLARAGAREYVAQSAKKET